MKEKISEETFQKMADTIWLDFLTAASPVEIHQSVITSNWDGNEFLRGAGLKITHT